MIRYRRNFGIHTLLILLFISAVFCLTYCGRIGNEGDVLVLTQEAESESLSELVDEPSIPLTVTEPSSEIVETETTTEPLQPTCPPDDDTSVEDPQPTEEENPPGKGEHTPIELTSLSLNDYVLNMFETAIEYVDDDGKTYIVEPPPPGRSDELQKKIIPLQSTHAPLDYLDDAIFIGDSVTTGFESFRKDIKFCGEKIELNYKVFAAKSYGAYNSTLEISDTTVHPLYKGDQFYPEDIIGVYESRKVFLCIGLNDAGWQKEDQFIRYYRSLLTKIKEKNPDVKIIITSITPLTVNGESTTTNELKNPRIADFNNLLINLADEENVYFLDYAYALRDENNNLYTDFSSDDYCHLVASAYSRILEYIFFHPVN